MKRIMVQEGCESELHLCNSCSLEIPTCPSEVAIWGKGKGNDNIVACLSYVPLIARDCKKCDALTFALRRVVGTYMLADDFMENQDEVDAAIDTVIKRILPGQPKKTVDIVNQKCDK